MRVRHRKIFFAIFLSALSTGAAALSFDSGVHCSPEAVPAGHLLAVVFGEGWLPEPFQTQAYKTRAVGSPLGGCLSVVNFEMKPEGAALQEPVTLTFDCDSAAGRAIAYGYIDGKWTALPSTNDNRGRVSISVKELTTYALLNASIS